MTLIRVSVELCGNLPLNGRHLSQIARADLENTTRNPWTSKEDNGWLCWYQATYLGTPVRVARIPPGRMLQMQHACLPESGSMRLQFV